MWQYVLLGNAGYYFGILLRDTLRLLLGTGTDGNDDGDNIDGDTGDD